MSNRSQSSYRNSDLARNKGKKGGFLGFFNSTLKRHRSEVGLVEDSHNSTTIIRIIVGLLLVHLIIIGGVILHGKIDAGSSAVADSALTPPPVVEVPSTVAPQPVPGPVANPGHITQPTPSGAVAVEEPVVEVEAVEPVSTPATPATPTTPTVSPADTPHKVAVLGTGETLTRFAAKHNTTVAAVLAINPEITNPNRIAAGTNIRVPLPADSAEAKQIAADREAARMEREGVAYKVRSGDNLGKIANRFGTSVSAIQKLNNMSNTNIRIGQEISIPATPKAREYAKDPNAFFSKPASSRNNTNNKRRR